MLQQIRIADGVNNMDTKERLKNITEFWFLTEPLLFAAYCTHEFIQNDRMKIPFRTGLRKIEYNSNIIKDFSNKQIMEYLKIEIIRIILKFNCIVILAEKLCHFGKNVKHSYAVRGVRDSDGS